MKATSTIMAGACGFTTRAKADFDEKSGNCTLSFDTNCPHFAKVAAVLHEVHPDEEFNWEKSRIHAAMHANCSHTACPVPSGIVKAVQTACGKKAPATATIITQLD